MKKYKINLKQLSLALGIIFASGYLSGCLQQPCVGAACGDQDDGGGINKDPEPTTTGETTKLTWGGGKQLASGNHANKSSSPISSFFGDPSAYCFDNNVVEDCVKADASIRSAVSTNPVAINGFRLGITKKTGDVFKDFKAWFQTGEPRVDPATGAFRYVDKQIRRWNGTGWDKVVTAPTTECNPTDGKAVGYNAAAGDSQKILTGLQVYTDGVIGGGYDSSGNLIGYNRTQVHLNSGKVWYQGLIPEATSSSTNLFDFKILPELTAALKQDDSLIDLTNFAQSSSFGLYSDQGDLEESTASTHLLPRIGLEPADQGLLDSSLNPKSRWDAHVIIGFCMNGTRDEPQPVGETKKITHPLFFGMDVRTHAPSMAKK